MQWKADYALHPQTLMSTAIFQSDQIGPGRPSAFARFNPVQLYLVLSLLLTVATLLFWAAFHFWDKRHEKKKEKYHKDAEWQD